MSLRPLLALGLLFALLVAACGGPPAGRAARAEAGGALSARFELRGAQPLLWQNDTLWDFMRRISLERFRRELDKFAEQDAREGTPPGRLLFVGSSSIRVWDSLARDMAPAAVVRRGFGGSTLWEVLQHFELLVARHRPRAIFLYAGENDLTLPNVSPGHTADCFRAFAAKVLEVLPETRIYFLSVKPSPLRWHLREKFRGTNAIIEELARKHPRIEYIDVAGSLLDPLSREPDPALFRSDRLHLNDSGYQRWTQIVRPLALAN